MRARFARDADADAAAGTTAAAGRAAAPASGRIEPARPEGVDLTSLSRSRAPRRYDSHRGEVGFPRAGSPQPTPPAARAAGHIERFVRVAHSSQPGAADSFCAPTAGDAVLPLS